MKSFKMGLWKHMNKKEYFEFLINEYDEGRAHIKGNHPDDIKTAVGLTIKLNEHTTFKPYVEYLADSEINDFKKQYMMLGTALTFKF